MRKKDNAIYFDNQKEVTDILYALAMFHTLRHATEPEEIKSVDRIMKLMHGIHDNL